MRGKACQADSHRGQGCPDLPHKESTSREAEDLTARLNLQPTTTLPSHLYCTGKISEMKEVAYQFLTAAVTNSRKSVA